MSCKGICGRYKAQKPSIGSRYANGQKRCQECEIFMNATENQIYCVCCNSRLRGKPRKMEYKEKVRAEKESKEEQSNIIDACKKKEFGTSPIKKLHDEVSKK